MSGLKYNIVLMGKIKEGIVSLFLFSLSPIPIW